MKQATLLFLIDDKRILLAMKKRGFGAGRWNGVGGKPEADETIEAAAIRECQEEIGVKPLQMKEVATLDFRFPGDKRDLDQQVIVFTCLSWEGETVETEEMAPQWYDLDKIPYDEMWSDDIYWLPKVLDDQYVTGNFLFDTDDNLLEHEVKP